MWDRRERMVDGNDDDHQQENFKRADRSFVERYSREGSISLCDILLRDRCLHINSSVGPFRCFADRVIGVLVQANRFRWNRCQVSSNVSGDSVDRNQFEFCLEQIESFSHHWSDLARNEIVVCTVMTIALSSIEYTRICVANVRSWFVEETSQSTSSLWFNVSLGASIILLVAAKKRHHQVLPQRKQSYRSLLQFLTFLKSKSGKVLIADSSYRIDDIGDDFWLLMRLLLFVFIYLFILFMACVFNSNFLKKWKGRFQRNRRAQNIMIHYITFYYYLI